MRRSPSADLLRHGYADRHVPAHWIAFQRTGSRSSGGPSSTKRGSLTLWAVTRAGRSQGGKRRPCPGLNPVFTSKASAATARALSSLGARTTAGPRCELASQFGSSRSTAVSSQIGIARPRAANAEEYLEDCRRRCFATDQGDLASSRRRFRLRSASAARGPDTQEVCHDIARQSRWPHRRSAPRGACSGPYCDGSQQADQRSCTSRRCVRNVVRSITKGAGSGLSDLRARRRSLSGVPPDQ